jgi:hypothetical protein
MHGYTQTTGKHYEGTKLQCLNPNCSKIISIARDELEAAKGSRIVCPNCNSVCGPHVQTTATLKPQER